MDQGEINFTKKLPPAVAERIEDGKRRADENADPNWKYVFDGCVNAAAQKKREITVDDVLDEYDKLKYQPGTHNLAAIGPAMTRAASHGVLTRTNEVVRSKRPESTATDTTSGSVISTGHEVISRPTHIRHARRWQRERAS